MGEKTVYHRSSKTINTQTMPSEKARKQPKEEQQRRKQIFALQRIYSRLFSRVETLFSVIDI